MNIRQLTGEINGKDIINIGDLVKVTHISGREHTGRLNSATKEEIRVGMSTIKVEEIIKMEEIKNEEK